MEEAVIDVKVQLIKKNEQVGTTGGDELANKMGDLSICLKQEESPKSTKTPKKKSIDPEKPKSKPRAKPTDKINEQQQTIEEQQKIIQDLQLKLKNATERLDKWEQQIFYTINCKTSAKELHVPGMEPFIESKSGSNGILVYRRLNNSDDFGRNFSDYKMGFRNDKDEFWIGLERIHKITTHEKHDLNLQVIQIDQINTICFRSYDFLIAPNEEKYKLKSKISYTTEYSKFFESEMNVRKHDWWNSLNEAISKNTDQKYHAVELLLVPKSN